MSTRACIAVILLASASFAETRTFTVYVDKKPCGTHEVVIKDREDGAQLATSKADVTVKVAFITYRYSFQSTELWKGGRLAQFSSATNDNGKKHTLSIDANAEGYRLDADGKATDVRGAHWVTNYWRLPPDNQRAQNMRLIDADTGKLIDAKFERVGLEKVDYLGRSIECLHYRLRGGVEVDLWFDGDNRLVRQESVEEGHRTLLELTKYQKD